MDSVLTQNAHFPSADPLPEDKVFCELAAMRQILEPHLLRIESEIRSIVKASCNMQETLERIEQQQSALSVRFEGKSVCDIDDHSHYLIDVKGSMHPHLQHTNSAPDFVEQPFARPSEEIEDRSTQRGFLNMQAALVKNVDGPINDHRQPTSISPDDVKEQMAPTPMEIDHVRRTDKLIVGHDEPKAITSVVNQEEILNGSRAECQIDLPNIQESLRKVLREEFRDHEVSVIQQLSELQYCAKTVMNQSARAENQEESVMKWLAPVVLMSNADEPTAATPVVNQEEIQNGLRVEHVQLQQVDPPNFQESLRKVLREEFRDHEVSVLQQLTEFQNSAKQVISQTAKGENQQESVSTRLVPVACMTNASDQKLNEDDRRLQFFPDEQATLRVIDGTAHSPSASPVAPGVKVPTAAHSPKPGQTEISEARPTKRQGIMSTFDLWFAQRFSESNQKDKDVSDMEVHIKETNSFAEVFILDRNLEKPPYRMEDFFKSTGWVQALVRSDKFQNLTLTVVCVNALWVGFAHDRNPELKLYSSRPIFIVAEMLFCSFFTIELALRFITFKTTRDAFRDGWFRFDFFLVATMILDTAVLMLIMQIMDAEAVRFPIAPFRTLRLLKLTRMARLMKAFPELVTMIRSMLRAVRAVASMCILVTLLVYIWGIIMTTLLKEEKELNDRLMNQSKMDFSDLNNAMWILFMNGALLLDNSAPLLTQLVFGNTFNLQLSGALLLVFVFLTYFLVLQMLTGIFCDVVIQVREEHRNEHDVRLIKQELTTMLKRIDDGDGRLTQSEVLEFINSGNTKAVLRQMGINLIFLFQFQEVMFDRQTQIKIGDFLELMLLCRSHNHATVETLAGGFCFIGKEIERLQMHLAGKLEGRYGRGYRGGSSPKVLSE